MKHYSQADFDRLYQRLYACRRPFWLSDGDLYDKWQSWAARHGHVARY